MMDSVLLGTFITGMFAAVVAVITVRGQGKAADVASKAESNRAKVAEHQAVVDNWKAIAADAKATAAELRRERDEAVDERDREHALNLALQAANDRLTAELTRLKERHRDA